MKIRVYIFLSSLVLSAALYAKNAGNLLEQYLSNPTRAVMTNEFLAFVEIISVQPDKVPKDNWKQTGLLRLRTIESIGGQLPKEFDVDFKKRSGEGNDAWTWDYVVLEPKKRLLGFFTKVSDTNCYVRADGRTDVINNPNQIKTNLLKKAQKLFKTKLIE